MNRELGHKSNKLFETSDLLFLWRLVVKNIYLLILIPILAYAAGYIYSYRMTSYYGAEGELLLKSNETYDYQDPIYKGLGAYGVYMDVQNQIRILKSYDLIGEVIDQVHFETSYYIVGRLKKQEVFGTLPFRAEVTILNQHLYENPISIKILDFNKYSISYDAGAGRQRFERQFDQSVSNHDLILSLNKNYNFHESNMKSITEPDYELVFHSRDNLVRKYRSRLEVENLEHTSILRVSITDELQPRAKVFLDSLTKSYINYSQRIQLEVNLRTLENIEKQIDTVQAFIHQKEGELLHYKDEYSILNIDREEENFFTEYLASSKEKRAIERKLASVHSLREYLKGSNDGRLLPPFYFIEKNDLYLSNTIDLIREKQISLEIDKTYVTNDNPKILNIETEIASLQNDVLDYLDNLESALLGEIRVFEKYINRYESDIRRLPKSAQGVLNLERELEVNNRMYLFLLEKKTNTLIARAGIVPQVRLIEQIQGLGVIYPNKTKTLRLFMLGGVILAFLLALMRNLIFNRLKNVQELAEVTNLTIAGGVPLSKNPNYDLVVESGPKSNITESFRTIRTNLSFMPKSEKRARKILISSFHPSEGKTFCSSNLATLIAKGGKKVLFVDFDLHRPKIHKVFSLDNKTGVSMFLIGKTQIEDVIRKDFLPNLDVITAGPVAPNPSELILSDKVSELFAWAEKTYDFVIIDTPPFGILNDSFELLKKVDNLLVVARAGKINRRGVKHIEALLERSDQVSKAIIMNGIRQSKFQYYYSKYVYSYSYGYRYSYGYGYSYGDGYGAYTENEKDD